MPKFKGEFRDYIDWKNEFKESILPHFDDKKGVRLLNEHSPKETELRNCSTVAEAWILLDSKYANPHLISTILIDDYVKFQPRGKTQEAKLVDIRNNLVKLDDDLKSVDCQKELETNSWIHQKVFKDLPLYWQNKFSEDEDEYIRKEGNRWNALFKLIKDEAFRIETKLAHRLDPKINESSHDSSSKSSLDFSKLPKKLQRQVNAALTKYDGGGKSPGAQDSSSKSSFNPAGKRTARFDYGK